MSEDLSFNIVNEDNEEITCDVLLVIPNDDNINEPYIVFTDYLLDEDNEYVFQYGKIVIENDEYTIKRIEDNNLVEQIKDKITEEMYEKANEQVQANLFDFNNIKETFIKKNEDGLDIEYHVIGYYEKYRLYTDFIPDDSQIGFKIYVDFKENDEYNLVDSKLGKEIIKKFNNEIIKKLKSDK